jgi:hypothetical protein
MKISAQTKKILENFVSINSGIVIRKTPDGQNTTTLKTVNRDTSVFASVDVPEIFPENICLFNLKTFLSVLSATSDPEVEFKEDYLTVKSDKGNKVKIVYADPGLIHHTSKTIKAPEWDFSFSLEQETLSSLLNMSSILELPNFKLFNRGKTLILQALDKKNPNTNTFDVEVGTLPEDYTKDVEVYIKRDTLVMLPGDYEVSVNTSMIIELRGAVDSSLVYYIALEISE